MIRIHPWLYNAIVRRGDILAVHPDYFQLTGGLERWLYRLARKAVPDKAHPPAIRFKMETLHVRSGVTRDLKRFAFDIRKIAETQPLPEYGVTIEYRKGRRELVTLYRDQDKPRRPPRGRRLKTIRGEQVEPAVNVDAYLEKPQPTFVIEPSPEVEAAKAGAFMEGFAELKQQLAISKPEPAAPLKADFTFPDGTCISIKPPSSTDPEAALRQLSYYVQRLQQLQRGKPSEGA